MTNPTPHSHEPAPRVLVIDDSLDVHRLLRARLRTEGIEIVSTMSGAEGIEAARAESPALILLDLDMPDMDGFEVLRVLKSSEATLAVPVIVLSGLDSPEDKVTAFDLGAVDYVTKPFDLMELRVRVRSALNVHRLLQMLAERAHVDGLTGLWNRAHFDQRWAEEVSAARRHNRPLSLAMLDIDHFKAINDTFGHPAGDAMLRGFADMLLAECRQSDVACRFGGEEFALIMPETPPTDAALVCERVLKTLRELCWPRHPERFVTASAGVAGSVASISVSPQKWLEAADAALYKSKRAGRDRVTMVDLGDPKVRMAV